MNLDDVRRVADAVLYEGYILYPYRASAQKNRSRWQFGVLMPPAYAAADPSESATARAECVFEHSGTPSIEVFVRFLQVQRRRTIAVAVAGGAAAPSVWDEAVEQEVSVAAAGPALFGPGAISRFTVAGGSEYEARPGTRVVRERALLTGSVSVRARRLPGPWPRPGPWQAGRLTVRISNETVLPSRAETREAALPSALVAAHVIMTVSGGAFISMTDPPEWAGQEVAACENIGCWPVLAGPAGPAGSAGSAGSAGPAGSRQVMLASPIILPDHPEVAPESPGELYDGTEIDEILTLRTLALSDEEKAAARATDPRAAALIDRIDAMDAPAMERLHGTIRSGSAPSSAPASTQPSAPPTSSTPPSPPPTSAPPTSAPPTSAPPSASMAHSHGPSRENGPFSRAHSTHSTHSAAGSAGSAGSADVPWWDPGADSSVSPGTDSVMVAGHRVSRGSQVVLRPGARRADAQDMFLAGRTAIVEAVLVDVDDTTYLAVSLAEDPAADLHAAHGRFLYFSPDEVEPR